MPVTTTAVKAGDKVSYEDQANPLKIGRVHAVDLDNPWSPFTIEWEDGTTTNTDLRQHGWSLVAGDSWDGTPFEDAPFVHTYSRAQAIDDGLLVDVTAQAAETGFRWPVAMTRGAWAETVEWDQPGPQSERGRLHDVLWMAYCRIKATRGHDADRLEFELLRTVNDLRRSRPTKAQLVMVVTGGDEGEPVITIMLPGED